jgi:uncharacterized protein YdaU (DUF1376 family)
MSTPPAFQFYPQDFLVGTADMTPEEVGAYIRLLCYQWAKGSLPNDQAKCAAMAASHGNAIASIWHKFGIGEDGRMRNERLELVRLEQDQYRSKQSENAKKRWVGNATAMPPHSHGNANGHAKAMPEACPSPSSSKKKSNIVKLMPDEEWMAGIESSEAFKGIDVQGELKRAQRWCANKGRKCTRRFFENWLTNAARDGTVVKSHGNNGTPDILRGASFGIVQPDDTFEKLKADAEAEA